MPVVDHNMFRSAMSRLGAAVNLITSEGPAGRHGLTASAVCSVTDDPPTVLVCINRASASNACLKANGVLCVNVLAAHHAALSERFADRSSRASGRFSDETSWSRLSTGSPVLNDASVALDCRIASVSEVGTHSVFFCEVEAVRIADRVEGLIYFNRAYHPIGEHISR
jgi:flavin reductase